MKEKKPPVRFGSVCSGIEAASVAWLPLGWECAFHAEIEPFPCAVLAHHYPEVPNLGDFTKIDGCQSINVLVGGTPCQSFSVAGRRAGLDDPRGNLAIEFLRLARRLRPDWVVWENVPGVLSSGEGRDFGSFLGILGELGYGWAYRVLDAQYVRVDGLGRAVPQRRRRVFVVGHPGDWRRPVAVLFDRESLSGHPPPRREEGSDPARALTAPAGGGGYRLLSDGQETFVAHTLMGESYDAMGDGTGQGIPLVPYIINAAESCATASHAREAEVSRCLDSNGSFASAQGGTVIAFQERGRAEGRRLEYQEELSYALKAPDGDGCWDWLRIADRERIRRLTPRECERLQGFPDDWTLIPYHGKPAKDGPRYKAIGNSMAVNVMRWISMRIDMVQALTRGNRGASPGESSGRAAREDARPGSERGSPGLGGPYTRDGP